MFGLPIINFILQINFHELSRLLVLQQFIALVFLLGICLSCSLGKFCLWWRAAHCHLMEESAGLGAALLSGLVWCYHSVSLCPSDYTDICSFLLVFAHEDVRCFITACRHICV